MAAQVEYIINLEEAPDFWRGSRGRQCAFDAVKAHLPNSGKGYQVQARSASELSLRGPSLVKEAIQAIEGSVGKLEASVETSSSKMENTSQKRQIQGIPSEALVGCSVSVEVTKAMGGESIKQWRESAENRIAHLLQDTPKLASQVKKVLADSRTSIYIWVQTITLGVELEAKFSTLGQVQVFEFEQEEHTRRRVADAQLAQRSENQAQSSSNLNQFLAWSTQHVPEDKAALLASNGAIALGHASQVSAKKAKFLKQDSED